MFSGPAQPLESARRSPARVPGAVSVSPPSASEPREAFRQAPPQSGSGPRPPPTTTPSPPIGAKAPRFALAANGFLTSARTVRIDGQSPKHTRPKPAKPQSEWRVEWFASSGDAAGTSKGYGLQFRRVKERR